MVSGAENKKMEKAIHIVVSANRDGLSGNPSSPFIPITKLIAILSRTLPYEKVHMMKKIRESFVEISITRQEMVNDVKSIVGDDDLLVSVIKAYINAKHALLNGENKKNEAIPLMDPLATPFYVMHRLTYGDGFLGYDPASEYEDYPKFDGPEMQHPITIFDSSIFHRLIPWNWWNFVLNR
ncbi:uncharacterized protein A4U43_C07F31180 [Asparagus officinalis]|uniref:RST domain-containing protein n=1 Tax=Asparagus officinalis TaxID=4686 RepID=A0A5P1EGD0_ASPOF|nr:uncharacterized protein A4U43_C07F31180 [Asparagus officinalis]